MARALDLDEHWTLLEDERELIAGKRGPTRLGFAVLLKFFTQMGRFPRGRSEAPDGTVRYVARQVGVEPGDMGFYERTGRTIECHRAQIREYLGFRECSVADADTLAEWLAGHVCEAERRSALVRVELLARCRAERAARSSTPVAVPSGRCSVNRPARGSAGYPHRRPFVPGAVATRIPWWAAQWLAGGPDP